MPDHTESEHPQSDHSELDHEMERRTAEWLHGLPPRRAPLTLEARVLSELRRRAALPWWRHNFARWPLAARSVFLALCAAVIGLTTMGGAWEARGVQTVNDFGAASLSWAHPARSLAASAAGLATTLVEAIPTTWLYLGLGLCVALYSMLLGLGAAAYRTLYLQPERQGIAP
jgi:hypothetical protein